MTDAGRRQLRSSDAATCVLQRTSTRFGDQAFGVSGPSVWNSLPIELRQSHLSLIGQFRRALKRIVNQFSVAPMTVALSAPYIYSYLLTFYLHCIGEKHRPKPKRLFHLLTILATSAPTEHIPTTGFVANVKHTTQRRPIPVPALAIGRLESPCLLYTSPSPRD